MPNLQEGEEILARAMTHLIDMDNGSFERLVMAVQEVSTLKRDFLNEPAVEIYFEIDQMFDKSNTHETQSVYWKCVSEMSEDQMQELASKIFLLYRMMCRASAPPSAS